MKDIDIEHISELPPILKDPIMKSIRNGLVGWCPDKNIQIIDICTRVMPLEGAIIEIGSYCGLSTAIIAHCLRRYKKTNPFYSVDNWYFEGYKPNTTVSDAFTHDDWRYHTEGMFKLAMCLMAKNINHSHIKLQSNPFFEAWEQAQVLPDLNGKKVQLGGDIAFAYIDGDHSYHQAKQDFLNVDKFLVPGGICFFDDSADDVPFGCRQAALEVEQLPNYQLIFQDMVEMPNKCFVKKSL